MNIDLSFLASYMTADLAIFIAIQFVNVILSTVKSVMTVNGDKLSASLWNTVSYCVGAVVTKMLTQQSFEIIIIVSAVTNMIGTYVGKWILEKMRHERLWTINATIRNRSQKYVEDEFLKRGVQYTLLPAVNDRMLLCTYSYSKAESSLVKEILDHESVRYTVVESIGGSVQNN